MGSPKSSMLDSVIKNYGKQKGSPVALLQAVQKTFGYLPQETLRDVAVRLNIPLSKLFSIATFYNSFALTPPGKNTLSVCLGTACHVRGGEKLVSMLGRELGIGEAEGTSADGEFTVKKVRCLGCCSMAPVVRVNQDIHGSMTQSKVAGLIKKQQKTKKR